MTTTTLEIEQATGELSPHWVNRAAFQVISALMVLNFVLLWAAVHGGHYWLAVPLVLTLSHFMHGQMIGFHEASHGLLRKNRKLNEIDGVFLGSFSFMSFSLYRASHQSHHAKLGSERDEELWPFTVTTVPRWQRILAAVVELNAGMFFPPFLFYRTFFRKDSPIRNVRLRRRIWWEIALTVAIWAAVVAGVSWFGVWKYFLWMYFVPAYLAGNLQSWRKYIEHVGLTGSTVNGSTRSIVSVGPMGKLVSLTLLHEPYHGVHHRFSGIPHAELPAHVEELEPKRSDENAPFPSYWHALVHLCRNLADPRVGAQWQTISSR